MPEARHTEGEWSFHPVHPHEIENGVVTTHWDEPPKLYAVKTTFFADYPGHGENLRTTVYIADAHITHGRRHEAEANARLLAAAPSLLASAQAVVKQWDTPNWKLDTPTADLINGLREAIAKATASSSAG